MRGFCLTKELTLPLKSVSPKQEGPTATAAILIDIDNTNSYNVPIVFALKALLLVSFYWN